MDSHCQLKRSFAYAGLGSKCFISYCYMICISFCTSAKQTTPVCRLRFSIALTQSCMLSRQKRYALIFAGDLRDRTQQLQAKLANIAASILSCASLRSSIYAARKDDTGTSFYLMATPVNFTEIEHHLRVSYQAHQRHSSYSLC